MGKNKLRKFDENKKFKNLFQPSWNLLDQKPFKLKGKWNVFFGNDNPIVLELGCGRGEYTIGLSIESTDKNFIGLDIKGARLWFGAKISNQQNLSNVAFVRCRIEQLTALFEPREISEIWLTFPDPQIKFKRTKHRLLNTFYLNVYKEILNETGQIHLKTDSEFLYGYTLGMIEASGYKILSSHHDIYAAPDFILPDYIRNIRTYYENKFLEIGKPIAYINFKF